MGDQSKNLSVQRKTHSPHKTITSKNANIKSSLCPKANKQKAQSNSCDY